MRLVINTVAAVAIAAFSSVAIPLPAAAQAQSCCCTHCGCNQGRKVCRLVCEMKKLEVDCFKSECEQFCMPGHCRQCDRCCEDACCEACCEGSHCGDAACCGTCDGGCGPCGSGSRGLCIGGKRFVWRVTIPGCARIFTKKKLLKKTVTKEVPVYKWVIEDLCADCEAACEEEAPAVPKDAKVPPPPAVDAVFHYGKEIEEPVRLQLSDSTR